MIIFTDIKKYKDIPKIQQIIPAVIFVLMGIALVALPQVFATSLNITREISSSPEHVWNIISNVDNDTAFWPTFKEIKNIHKTDNIIERDVTISAGP